MKNILLFTIIISLLSCTSKEEELKKIDVFNEVEINNFMKSFLENNKVEENQSSINLKSTPKFIGNRLDIDPNVLKYNGYIISRKEFDALFSEGDRDFIQKQVDDRKNYVAIQKYFDQKILNADSLKDENLKFDAQHREIFQSLLKKDVKAARSYFEKTVAADQARLKKHSPIIYFNKPIFFKDKNKVIISYHFSSGYLSSYYESAIYKYKNGKWIRSQILMLVMS